MNRREQLQAGLSALGEGSMILSGASLSETLLFGLDFELISARSVSEMLLSRPAEKWCRTRFAPRLLSLGVEELWTLMWGEGDDEERRLMLLSAGDQLGTNFALPGTDGDDPGSDSLRRTWEFLLKWEGGPTRPAPLRKEPNHLPELQIRSLLCGIGFSASGKTTLATAITDFGIKSIDADSSAFGGGDAELRSIFSTMGASAARAEILRRLVSSDVLRDPTTAVFLGSSTTSSPLGRRALLNAEGLIVHIYAPQLRTISRLKENPSHPIGEFALDECDASQLSRIQRIRADNYYSADLRLNTAHLSISETARTLARLSGL